MAVNEKDVGRKSRVSVVLWVFIALGTLFLCKNAFTFSSESVHGLKIGSDDSDCVDIERQISLGLTPRKPVVITDLRTGNKRKLHGRFLHITDMHPDEYYVAGTSIDNVCHSGEPTKGKDRAAKFGNAMSGCDSPMLLMDMTLDWIDKNLKDQIDFVVWTGDNIRHDNDRTYPRTEDEIFRMNAEVAEKIKKIFRTPNSPDPRDFAVPVVPSIGNNDVFPHNLFSLGPTLQTREYYRLWGDFIPEEQQRMFDRDASFFTEVIPGKLAVLSFNTLYLFKANPLVDNCDSRKQPGYQLLLWLGYVLDEIRERGMKVWISGHVPPIAKNYDSSCYDKFSLWMHEYRDVIIGGLYGHMNMDHFVPVDVQAIRENMEEQQMSLLSEDERLTKTIREHAIAAREAHLMGAKPVNKESYLDGVLDTYYKGVLQEIEQAVDSDLDIEKKKKKKGKKKKGKKEKRTLEEIYDQHSIVQVSGSVIPTFNPSIRVWEYNISDITDSSSIFGENQLEYQSWDLFFEDLEHKMKNEFDDNESSFWAASAEQNKKKKKKNGKPDKSIPRKKPDELPAGPGHIQQLFSPTKFVQYFADLDSINSEYEKLIDKGLAEHDAINKAFNYEVEYTSKDEPYPMESLLVKDYLHLAADLARDNGLWKIFKERAFISTGYEDERN